jgi:hypothetical protein
MVGLMLSLFAVELAETTVDLDQQQPAQRSRRL